MGKNVKKIAHLVGALVLAAGGTLGLALPAAAAPALTAPAWAGVEDEIEVLGTECLGTDALVLVTLSDSVLDDDMMPPVYEVVPDRETGNWSVPIVMGSVDLTVTASCTTYNATTEYTPVTIQVWQDALGDPTLAGCVVTIPYSVALPGTYRIDVGDDGETLDSFPIELAAAGAGTVSWTISEPARPGDPGVGFSLIAVGATEDEDEAVAVIPNYEYPSDVALNCAQANVTLSFPGYTGEVVAGGTLKIDAAGFLPGEKITVTLYSTPVVLATLLADAQGRVLTTVTIPAATAPGAHTIEVKGESSGLKISLPILVKAGAAGPTTTTSRPTSTPAKYTPLLAKTGTTASALVPWAAGLMLVGGAALAFTRRRSNNH